MQGAHLRGEAHFSHFLSHLQAFSLLSGRRGGVLAMNSLDPRYSAEPRFAKENGFEGRD